jgi:hypothetical protein
MAPVEVADGPGDDPGFWASSGRVWFPVLKISFLDCTLKDSVVIGGPETMFWRIVFWVAVAEVALCILPIEVTGMLAMVRFLFLGG